VLPFSGLANSISASELVVLPGALTCFWRFIAQKKSFVFRNSKSLFNATGSGEIFHDSWFYTLTRSLTGGGDSQRAQSEESSKQASFA